jgi:phosphoglucomutase
MKEMNAVVDKMKTLEIKEIGGIKVNAIRDYSKAEKRCADGTIEPIDSAKTNAVYYELDGGSFICIRPSGTEPKLKVYYSLKCESEQVAKEKFDDIKTAFEQYIK